MKHTTSDMISDKQTNVVYLAEGLKHYMPAYMRLLNALNARRVHMKNLPLTASKKHIWARDYMPIQLDKGRFLLYAYHPDYLHGFEDFIPEYRAICKELGLECVSTDIVLDGGNVVKCGDKVIMTDKIIDENPMRFYKDMLRELENHFQAQIVLIPRDKYDRYGHADGMVRWIDGNRVLLNNYADFDPKLGKEIKAALSEHFTVEELRYGTNKHLKVNWAYINFLQVDGEIFVPGLGIEEDQMAIEQIQKFYPDYNVRLVPDCLNIIKDGGALNCVSWNILADAAEWPKEEA